MDQKQPPVYKVLSDSSSGTPGFHRLADMRPSVIYGRALMMASWLLLLLAIPLLLDTVIGDIFVSLCTSPLGSAAGYNGCLGAQHFIAVVLFLLFTFVGLILLGTATIVFARAKQSSKWMYLFLSFGTLVSTSVVVFVKYIQPGNAYSRIDALQRILSCYYFAAAVCLACAVAAIVYRLYKNENTDADAFFGDSRAPILARDEDATPSAVIDLPFAASHSAYGVRVGFALVKAFLLVFLFAGVFVLTGFFPAAWAWGTVSQYFVMWSPFAYNIVVTPNIIWKTYPDIVAYYSFILGIVLVGVLSTVFPAIRRKLHTRIRVHSPYVANIFKVFPHGITIGEILLLHAVIGLAAFWFYYWRFDFAYMTTTVYAMQGPNPLWQIYARTMGHMTNLSMSFLAFPVARNSLWEAVFGVPFERALKYHRGLGNLTYILVTIHMTLWYISFGVDGQLLNNLFTLTNLTVAPGQIHFDNFTVALVQLGWIILTFVVIIAWYRRNNWELFRFSHYFAILFLISALMHAWANWVYTTGGLILWLFDRCVRLVRCSTTAAELISAEHSHGVTRLMFQNPTFKASPGQYMFLHFPQLSGFEWHPFSVSSYSPSSVTFHIKSMGPGTFTQQLAEYVTSFPILKQSFALQSPGRANLPFDSAGDMPSSHQFTVYLDGPYGQFTDLSGRDGVLLIAGGIGCTPLVSVLSDLHRRFTAAQNGVALPPALEYLRRIQFVFCASDIATIYAFAPLLSEIKANNHNSLFRIQLFCTRRSGADVSDRNPSSFTDVTSEAMQAVAPMVQPGRPNIDAIVQEFAGAVGSNGIVAVCGPTTMLDATSEAAFRNHIDFYAETFEL